MVERQSGLNGDHKKVLIAEGHPGIREAISLYADHFGHHVVASVGSIAGLVKILGSIPEPDVAVFSNHLPERNQGIEGAALLQAVFPKVKIIAFSQYENPGFGIPVNKSDGLDYLFEKIVEP